MTRISAARWGILVAANVAAFCVLGFLQGFSAQAPAVNPPFANAIDLQMDIITQLKELNRQVKEQNALLRSGDLHVVIAENKKR